MSLRDPFVRKVIANGAIAVGFVLVVSLAPQWLLQVLILALGALMWDELRYYGDYRMRFLNRRHVTDGLYYALILGVGGMSIVLWSPHFRGMLLTVAAIIASTDIASEVLGRRFGKPGTLFPSLSPNKSLLGGIGGLAAGVLVVFCAIIAWKLWHTPLDPIIGYTLIAIPLLAIAGDLLESATKRKLQIKNFGSTLGVQTGGVLDRLDSWLLSFVAVGAAQMAVYYIG